MPAQRCGAFSLIELLTITSLLSLLLSLCLPAFTQLAQSNRDQALRNQLLAHLSTARGQAAIARRDIEICGSSNQRHCDGQWAKGWLLREEDSGRVLAAHPLPRATDLSWRGFGGQSIRYSGNGTSPSSNGRFTLCRNGAIVWELAISRQGRARHVARGEYRGTCVTNHPGG